MELTEANAKLQGKIWKVVEAALQDRNITNTKPKYVSGASADTAHVKFLDGLDQAVETAVVELVPGALVSRIGHAYTLSQAAGDEHDEKEYLFEIELPDSDSLFFLVGFKWFTGPDGQPMMRAGYSISSASVAPRLGPGQRLVF